MESKNIEVSDLDYKFLYEQEQEKLSLIKEICLKNIKNYDMSEANQIKIGHALAHFNILYTIDNY